MPPSRKPAARTSARGRTTSTGRSGGRAGSLLAGSLLGSGLTVLAALAYVYFGTPPVAVTDHSAPWEHFVTAVPLQRRAAAESRTPPFSPDEESFEAAAHLYRTECAQCHGTPGHDSSIGRSMSPRAQQFFSGIDRNATKSLAPGALYWATTFGVRRSGMPAFNHTLTNTQLWQISLLLHSSGDLPDPVRSILTANTKPNDPILPNPF